MVKGMRGLSATEAIVGRRGGEKNGKRGALRYTGQKGELPIQK